MAIVAEKEGKAMPTIVDIGPYKGLFGTMRSIIYEEGESARAMVAGKDLTGSKSSQVTKTKGQGIEGLWRGWRVGMWGLMGVWGAATLGGTERKSGEF